MGLIIKYILRLNDQVVVMTHEGRKEERKKDTHVVWHLYPYWNSIVVCRLHCVYWTAEEEEIELNYAVKFKVYCTVPTLVLYWQSISKTVSHAFHQQQQKDTLLNYSHSYAIVNCLACLRITKKSLVQRRLFSASQVVEWVGLVRVRRRLHRDLIGTVQSLR